jgi:hypothetical protein
MESIAKINGSVQTDDAIMERVIALGDLKLLKAEERNSYYLAVCRSLGLNPMTRPFEYITLNGKLVLYARKDCTEQLRRLHGISIVKLETTERDGVFEVLAYAKSKDGREDVDFGAVSIKGLQGDALVNAKLKSITKSKRRVTLSICGLGMVDETEIETIPTAQPVPAQIEAAVVPAPTGTITTDQKRRLKSLTESLLEFEIPAANLQKKMAEDHKVERSADLTEEQADQFIANLYDWLNSLEESRAANMVEKKEVPF